MLPRRSLDGGSLDEVVRSALKSFEADHEPAEETILRDIQELASGLKQKESATNSQQVPFTIIRDYVRTALSKQASNPRVVVAVSVLYIQLVRTVSLAYEELSLSTCIHHVSNVLKSSAAPEGAASKSGATYRKKGGSESVKQFYTALTLLVQQPSFDIQTAGFISLAMSAFGDLIRYSRGCWGHELVLKGVASVFDKGGCAVTPVLYKVLFPIVRAHLASRDLLTIAELLVMAGKLEHSSSPKPVETSPMSDDNGTTPLQEIRNNRNDGSRRTSENSTRQPLVRFFALSATHVPDRADQRSAVASLFSGVSERLEGSFGREFTSFILKASRHPKARVRLFALEYAGCSLKTRIGAGNASGHELSAADTEVLDMLAARIHDRGPSVRVKAVSALTEIFHEAHRKGTIGLCRRLIELADVVTKRLSDSKSRVRKAAVDFVGLACLVQLSLSEEDTSSNDNLQSHRDPQCTPRTEEKILELGKALQQRSWDSVSNVRLATITRINEIVTSISKSSQPTCTRNLIKLWCDVVLQHTEDVDARCKDASLKAVERILFRLDGLEVDTYDENLGDETKNPDLDLFDCFLEQLGGNDYVISEIGRKAVGVVCKAADIEKADVKIIVNKLQTLNRRKNAEKMQKGLWVILGELAENGGAELVIRMLGRELIIQEVMKKGSKDACKVAAKLAGKMTTSAKTTLFHTLRDKLFSVNMEPSTFSAESISSVMSLMSFLKCSCCPHLLTYCERLLMDSHPENDEDNEKLLVLIGGIFDFFAIPEDPSQELLTFVKVLVSNSTRRSKTRALALVTLGKICLCQGNLSPANSKQTVEVGKQVSFPRTSHRNAGELLTRRYISIFVHELDNPTSIATRNNAVMVLCDLCRQYTSVAEPYVGRFVSLLADTSDFVRIQVISSIVSLLQEDYIKLRTGPIFYRLVLCLLDQADSIRTTAEYALLNVISSKNPYLLATSFIELIFVLNNCSVEQTGNRNSTSIKGNLDLQVVEHDQRTRIYKVFLQGMSTEQRFKLPGRLRNEILSLVVDGKLSVSESSVVAVVHDTLELMSTEHPGMVQPRQLQTDIENDAEAPSQATDSQKDTNRSAGEISKQQSLLAKVYSIELREVTIPALLELRHALEKCRSPLLKTLMKSLCSLLRPYHKDLTSIVRDPTVRSEIEHEMNISAKEAHAKKGAKHKRQSLKECATAPSKVFHNENDPRALSVPRKKRPKTSPRLPQLASDSEEEYMPPGERNDQGRSRRLSMGIEASPKLAAIATRSGRPSKPVITVSADDQHSSFALALARIEDAADDKDS